MPFSLYKDLEDPHQLIKSIIDNVPGAIYRCKWDESFEMLFISDAFRDITGYSISRFIGTSKEAFIHLIFPDDVEESQAKVQEALRKGEGFDIEYRMIRKNGQIVWVNERGKGIYDEKTGNLLYQDGTFFDVTERKTISDELIRKEELLQEAEKLTKILIVGGENQNVELKSSLRWNLHSGKIGKEIEIAWLKTLVAFMNSDGGTLLIGVSDDGEILGTEIDKFKNDDRYLLHVNNAIKSHIGLEHITYLSFGLVPIQGKKILKIECQPSKDPVFLSIDGKEEFYARFGPSSRQLSTKEVLNYVKNR
ncbi:MAG: PAS domain-containing protein [Flavobacteriaceae bacterium]|nr:MAG: PAS domain-containing protein [Flavobacteriaceae bacterium]